MDRADHMVSRLLATAPACLFAISIASCAVRSTPETVCVWTSHLIYPCWVVPARFAYVVEVTDPGSHNMNRHSSSMAVAPMDTSSGRRLVSLSRIGLSPPFARAICIESAYYGAEVLDCRCGFHFSNPFSFVLTINSTVHSINVNPPLSLLHNACTTAAPTSVLRVRQTSDG